METIGMVTTVVVAAVAVGVLALVVKSMPDIGHYRRIRRM